MAVFALIHTAFIVYLAPIKYIDHLDQIHGNVDVVRGTVDLRPVQTKC